MAIYSVGRKRVILALLLTTALLLTLDLRGNPIIERGHVTLLDDGHIQWLPLKVAGAGCPENTRRICCYCGVDH